MKKTLIVLLTVSVACAASSIAVAGSMDFRILIDDQLSDVHVLDPGTHVLALQVKVDSPLPGGLFGGMLQAAVNIKEPDGVDLIVPSNPTEGFPPAKVPLWDATFADGLNLSSRGLTDDSRADIFAHTSAFPPGAFANNFATYGAGEWTTVTTGGFEYLGGLTELSVMPADGADGQLIFGDLTGGGTEFGAMKPETVGGYQTQIGVPEPSSVALIALGLLGLFGFRRRS